MWLVKKRHLLPTVLEAESLRSRCKHGSESLLLGCRIPVFSYDRRWSSGFSRVTCTDSVPFKVLYAYNLKTLLNPIAVGVNISACAFWENTNIQTMDLWHCLASETGVEVCAIWAFCGNVFFTNKRTHAIPSHVWNSKNNWGANLRKKGSILSMAGQKTARTQQKQKRLRRGGKNTQKSCTKRSSSG